MLHLLSPLLLSYFLAIYFANFCFTSSFIGCNFTTKPKKFLTLFIYYFKGEEVLCRSTVGFHMGSKTHPGDVWVLSIIDTKESSKLQQQFCAHWGIAMNPCYKADLGLRWFSFHWIVGNFQSPNCSKFDTLAETGHGRERKYYFKKKCLKRMA